MNETGALTNRLFSNAFNVQHAAPAFEYIYDPNATFNGRTGNWRPLSSNDVVPSASTVGVQSPSGAALGVGTALDSNSARHTLFVQNLSTGKLYGRFSSSLPTPNAFNFVLKGATASGEADGGTFSDDNGIYKGPLTLSGVSPYWVAWEM